LCVAVAVPVPDMGCSYSRKDLVIGQIIVTLTPSNNLEVGSYEFIHTLELTEQMFSKAEGDESFAANCHSLPPLDSSVVKMFVAFQISKEITVVNRKIDIALTRNGEELYNKPLFDSNLKVLSSVTYGCTTGNPVVSLSQAGDIYQIRFF
jgi:hypothetical protein